MFDFYKEYTQILKEELVAALGCTEPISLAYAAAKCKEYLLNEPEKITVLCSGNIIKNVKTVVVPNSNGLKGIETAVALGMIGGSASKNLEVLSNVTEEDIEKTKKYLSENRISVNLLKTQANLHFQIKMENEQHSSFVEVVHTHTNIVKLEQDNKKIISLPFEEKEINDSLTDRSILNINSIVEYGENIDLESIKPIIEPQIEFNSKICERGLKEDWGANVGRNILEHGDSSLVSKIKGITAAGSDARMSGCVSPVIINSGSGNQGITVSIPVVEYGKAKNFSHEKILRALAISNLIGIHQKTKIGRLSAYCGTVTAACGAGAAITWLDGGSMVQIKNTITNALATISGMICDGAKPSCAAKIAMAVETALLAHDMAMDNESFLSGDGIVKSNIEDTIKSIGLIASEGMKYTDEKILSVMIQR